MIVPDEFSNGVKVPGPAWHALVDIYSIEFDIRVNVASSLSLFCKAISHEPSVVVLRDQMMESKDVSQGIVMELYRIAGMEQSRDPRYENPIDTALAALLHLVHFVSPLDVVHASLRVLAEPDLWYARQLALKYIDECANVPAQSGCN